MSDSNNQSDQVDDGIPSVGDDDQKKKNQIFFMFMIFLLSAVVAILFVAASGDSETENEGDTLEAQVAREYETANRGLVIPPKDRPKKSNEDKQELLPPPDLDRKQSNAYLVRPTVAVPKPTLNSTDTESAEEKKARKKAEQLWEKRRRASPIVFDKNIQRDEERGRGTSSESKRHSIDIDAITKSVTSKVGTAASGGFNGRSSSGDKDKMASRLNSAQTVGVTASFISDKPFTIAEGKMLGCILETAIQSTLPGMTRCVLAENIYSYDGNKLLLRKGSRLVGQYEGGIQQGESRIFVIWTRIITPEGIDIALSSPGTGELGRAGHGVQIDSHFFERFGASALLSIVGGLTSSINENDVQLTEVGKSFNNSAEIALKDSIKIKPTGHKNQGERVKVFVARDIDFAPVLQLARDRLGKY